MWIFTIIYQISGMPTTLIYRVNGRKWETVGPKLYNALKNATGKLGFAVGKMSYEEFEGYFDEEGEAMFGEFQIRSVHPDDDHWIP